MLRYISKILRSKKKKENAINLKLIREVDGNSLFADLDNRILKIEWRGVVQRDSAIIVLNHALDVLIYGGCNRILFDRRLLKGFSSDAGKWVKNEFWSKSKRRILKYTERLATVGSPKPKTTLFTSINSIRAKMLFPWLKAAVFELEEDAIRWLIRR